MPARATHQASGERDEILCRISIVFQNETQRCPESLSLNPAEVLHQNRGLDESVPGLMLSVKRSTGRAEQCPNSDG